MSSGAARGGTAKKRGRSRKTTPLMEQYLELKRRHPDTILFFRLGDFYEMFYEDAEVAARLLGLTLTSRNRNDPEPIPLAGVPWHQRDNYVSRLLRLGHRVAICEQLEDPAESKGIVERGVTEILTPGSVLTDAFIEEGTSHYLCALAWSTAVGDDGVERTRVGFALIEASTGEFRLGEDELATTGVELARYSVSEWLLTAGETPPPALDGLVRERGTRTELPSRREEASEAGRSIAERFPSSQDLALDREDRALALHAASTATRYLDDVQGGHAAQLRDPQWVAHENALRFGPETRRSLELFEAGPEGREDGTLWSVLRRTVTGAGSRRLRQWIERPLLDPGSINERLDGVGWLVGESESRERLREALRPVYDLERLTARLVALRSSPRDLVALRTTLEQVPALHDVLADSDAAVVARSRESLDPHRELTDLLRRALVEEPPATAQEGGLIRPGYDEACDRLRDAARSGKTWIAELEARERERTGISSLKVGFNRVFGYYLEVTKTHAARVPEDYERRQTLTAAERYVTPELKRLEGEVLGAEEKLKHAEQELFVTLRGRAAQAVSALHRTASALADLDALGALAEVAVRGNYVRPEVHGGDRMIVRGARHPVVEEHVPMGRFVPNDLELDGARRQILLITGPNMGGKSTYLRTAGLLVVLAQAGSFVPAREAEIGVCDRIFTRVGAADALAAGRSTFMVEMVEVADILSQATPRSLVLLDEVGRGTSTYDGLALAWALTEELHRESGPRPRTLFATHYHELTRLGRELERLRNLHVRVREVGDEVVFLHEVAEGPADRSYGIHVARLAGIPDAVIVRARALLAELESQRAHALPAEHSALDPQLGLFGQENAARRDRLAALAEALEEVDLETTSPLSALNLLVEWKSRFREGGDGGEGDDTAGPESPGGTGRSRPR